MIARFFIDRPIFATVLSVLITLIGGIALINLPVAQYPRITPPGVTISISYPGASSEVVAATVAAPIEQQVNGVPGMLYMSSQMGNDGTYSLTCTFDIGTDLKTAVVMVQNRVTLAMPQLPTEVQNQGITIRKRTPDQLMIVNFVSPDDRYDSLYLSNYATIYVKDELLRVEGVADITYQGQRDYSIRIWLDPQKLASRNMTAIDVANAIRSQNLDAPSGRIGQPPAPAGQSFQLPVDTLGRLTDPEEFGNIIVKSGLQPMSVAAARPRAPIRARPAGSGTPGSTSAGTVDLSGIDVGVTPNTPATGGAATGGGATSTGGGTTAGGGATGGGGTTGGSATGGVLPDPTAPDASDSSMSGLSIANGTPDILSGAGGGSLTAPSLSSVPIVRLRDVARLELGAQNYNMSCTFDGKPSVGLSVFQLPGTNALDVADAVRKKMDELKTRFPDGVDYVIGYDTTPFIRESVMDVVTTMFEAVALVGLVVLVFLQDWRAMILPMIDVPVSIIGTFAVMSALGFSLNNISLFGLVLAVGIVVDDAIVVLENIERLIATGLDARAATIKAMDEVTGPIVAVALVLCAVFVPCAVVAGITGQFFRQFAVTIAVSTVISAINAITMTPSRAVLIFKADEKTGREHVHEALPWWIFALAAGLLTAWQGPRLLSLVHLSWPLRPAQSAFFNLRNAVMFVPGAIVGGLIGWFTIGVVNDVLGWLFRGFNRIFDGMTGFYGWTVGKMLRLAALVLVSYAGLIGLTWWVFVRAPTGFIPQQDMGRLIISVQLPDSSSLERTKEVVAQVDRICRETAGVQHTVAFAGMSFLLQASSPNFASMFVVLDPFDTRQKPSLRDTAIMNKLRRAWSDQIKDATVTVYGSSPIPGLGSAGGFRMMIQDRGGLGLDELQTETDAVVRKLRAVPGFNNVATQFRSNVPQLRLTVDRTKVAALGVPLNDVNQTMSMFLGSLYVNSFNEFGRHWQVTIQAEGDYRNEVKDVNLFQVRNNMGQMVPIGTLLDLEPMGGPISVTRYNLYTAASINGNIQTGVSTGEAIDTINRIAAATLPLSMKADWTELMFLQIRAGNTAIYVFFLAIVCVFLALAALYESWTLPLAVILVVPLCLLCSVQGVRWTDRDVNIFVQIGLVVLVGLACKNAILIVEYARHLHENGQSCFDATVLASRLRLRPILMTSFAFILGVVPLMIASGAGAEMRRSLGIAVFSGMLGVTLFGIFLTPVFFYVIQGLGETRLFSGAITQWTVSCAFGLLMGLAGGFLLWKLDVASLPCALGLGGFTGVLAVLAALGVHRKILPPRAR
jgi:multidrug efflux pump